MYIKKSAFKNILIGVVLALVSCGLLLSVLNNSSSNTSDEGNSTIEGGNQVVKIIAKNGFSPNLISAKADTETILRVSTNNTFDCSSSIRIPSLNISKVLSFSGDTDIPLGSFKSGTEIQGLCSMGMYSFKIKFS